MAVFGALEAGGTKMVLALMDENGGELERAVIPTEAPEETLPRMLSFFRGGKIAALGIGCFGPLTLDPAAPGYGTITRTPKLKWRNVPILAYFREGLNVPVSLDTDVNAAALAEAELGAARGTGVSLYLTVGTGIGGGLIVGGSPVHGLMHPEIGHMLLCPEEGDPAPRGFCPYHAHCAEGLAAGPAIAARWGVPAEKLPDDHPAWQTEAGYLAQLCANALMSFSPEKIILGGGVMHKKLLFPLIREKTLGLLNGYLPVPQAENGFADTIVPPALGDRSGITGAWLLAKRASEKG